MSKNELKNEAGNLPASVEKDLATVVKARREKLDKKWNEDKWDDDD